VAPGLHLLISWLTTVEIIKERRERALIALTGLAPDLDGAGIIVDFFTGTTQYYFKYHHYLGHSFLFAFLKASIAAFLAKSQKMLVWFLSLFIIHLHLICDLIGSRSPDGYQWPIYYFYPFNSYYGFVWAGQWELNAWQNQVIGLLLLIFCLYYLIVKKITFLEVFSKRLDSAAVGMYDRWRGNKV